MADRRLRAPTVAEALDSAVTAIGAAGVEDPRLDAEVLLAQCMGIQRTALVLDRRREMHPAAIRCFREAVTRRSAGREPVAYITGRRGFRHLEVTVDPRVLIPRPETELLVEAALGLAPGAHVLDLGTGSGAIALALKQERPDLCVSASDVSPEALAVARANGERLGLEIEWIEADLLVPEVFAARRVDALLANPPYVAESQRALLAPEITRHEPARALFGGPDGLAVIGRLIGQIATYPRLATVALEVGHHQAARVAQMLERAGFAAPEIRRDLAGIERVLLAQRARRAQDCQLLVTPEHASGSAQ